MTTPVEQDISPVDILESVPILNESALIKRGSRGGALVEIPLKRPKYMIPPLSWVLPFSRMRRVKLDVLGVAMLDICDGRRTVEGVIEKFAMDNKLTFREAQLPVMEFLKNLSERGVLVIAGISQGQ